MPSEFLEHCSLISSSGKHKATKNSNEAEYRAIFDNLIDDLLTVLFWPEWPAAALILSIASKFMVASLDDIKTNSQTDSNAAKTMALDHLGVIAARIRTSILKVQKQGQELPTKGLKPLEEVGKMSFEEFPTYHFVDTGPDQSQVAQSVP